MIDYREKFDEMTDLSDKATTIAYFASKDRSKHGDSEKLERLLAEYTKAVKETINSLKSRGF